MATVEELGLHVFGFELLVAEHWAESLEGEVTMSEGKVQRLRVDALVENCYCRAVKWVVEQGVGVVGLEEC